MATVEVFASGGEQVLIEDADLPLFLSCRWRASRIQTPGGRVYSYLNAKKGRVLFHRVVAGASRGQVVDHIDGNGLNNCRANLRLCTHGENMRNRRPNAGKTLPKGVSRRGRRFSAAIKAGTVRRQKTGFSTADEAAACYAAWAAELHGPFARIE